MSITTWWPGTLNKFWTLSLAGGLLMAAGFGVWATRTMTSKPHIISGWVHAPNGQPAVGARIYFTAAPVSMADMALITDQNGQFMLPAPAKGTYQIGCTADDFAPASVTVEVADADATQVEIVLRHP